MITINRRRQFLNYQTEDDFNLSIGDLMSALLMLFVLLLASTLLRLETEFEARAEIAQTYRELQEQLYQDLYDEFYLDLQEWSAMIDRDTLAIRFEEPDVLFVQGEAEVRTRFQLILDDFFPRYIYVLSKEQYRDSVEEIRIEGHTSSEWAPNTDSQEAYFNNLRLSQDRTRNVLEYCLGTINESINLGWARQHLVASGLSSSRPILIEGVEDPAASRRVEFRVRTDAETRISEILRVDEESQGVP